MKNLMKKFLKEEEGATIIEYVLILAVMAGIVMFAFPNLRNAITEWMTGLFGNVSSGLTDAESGRFCADGVTPTTDYSNC